jgi:predicted ATPase/class 3 adenylate cyclase
MADPADLPTGTVTFLFTDLEGSTRLLEAHPAAYRDAVRRHHALLRGAVEANGGVVFETVGDAVYAAFARPTDAVAAALAGQVALHQEDWGALGAAGALRARMGLHTGEVERQGGHYFGAPLYRCARLTATAHGGQVVLSAATAELVRGALPAAASLRDLGEHRLRDLAGPERVFQLGHPDLPAEFPALRTLDSAPNNLPLQLTSFVGREPELAEVAALLGTTRLLTLTGPGGTGKTRLALQAAANALEAYPDGVWLAELGALADPVLVPAAVAVAVGVREEPGRPLLATLTAALRPKRVLLVLDNCEHLLDACARLADALLRAGPHLRILATSREALGIAGETAWRVPSLAVPDAQRPPPADDLTRYEAVRLFAERAAAVQPRFAVTGQNAPAVAQICQRLDGIPLAIELAAARVRVLPPEPLLARLEDRFRLLTGGSRTALERHQTLQAAVDWSYDLLTDHERALFNRLAVFAGGWTLEAAEAVCAGESVGTAAVLDLLTRLVDKSLVVVEDQPDGTARYRLLETLRQYARQKLFGSGEADVVHRRHAAFYLALAADTEITPEALDRQEREHDNARAALRWLVEHGEGEQALRLGRELWAFWAFRGYYSEGRERLAALLALPEAAARTEVVGRVYAGAGRLAFNQGDYAAARTMYEQTLAIARERGDARLVAAALGSLGHVAREQGDYATARTVYGEQLASARAAGDKAGVGGALNYLGLVALQEGDYAAARTLLEEALGIHRELGRGLGATHVTTRLGHVAHAEGDHAAARARYEQSLATLRAVDDKRSVANLLVNLALVEVDEGDLAAARVHLEDAAALGRELQDRAAAAMLLDGFAGLAAAGGLPARAVRLAGAAAGLREGIGAAHPRNLRDWVERRLQPARDALTGAAFAAAWAAGQAMPLEQAVADALAENPDIA